MSYDVLYDPAKWAQVADAVDGMIAVARDSKLTTLDLTRELLRSQNPDIAPELRLAMMATAYATALQRLAAYTVGEDPQ